MNDEQQKAVGELRVWTKHGEAVIALLEQAQSNQHQREVQLKKALEELKQAQRERDEAVEQRSEMLGRWQTMTDENIKLRDERNELLDWKEKHEQV